jgi:hypothetical protein
MVKSVTFISMAITTFVIVLLAGVVYAYQGFALSTTTTPTVQPASDSQTLAISQIAPISTDIPAISPQNAASIAVKFSNRTDLYSVELADFNGSQVYKVTFSSGDAIYVAVNGQVVGSALPSQSTLASPTTQPKPPIVYEGPIKKRPTAGHGTSSGSSMGGSGSGIHEGGDD